MIRRFSPENLAFMEFRSVLEYELGKKIRSKHKLLGDLGYQFRRELHLTGDAKFLHKIGSKKLASSELPTCWRENPSTNLTQSIRRLLVCRRAEIRD